MKPIEGFETSAISNQTPRKHQKETILHVKHGESLKSRILIFNEGNAMYFIKTLSNDVRGSTCFERYTAHHQEL
jgi:hypothetical protein